MQTKIMPKPVVKHYRMTPTDRAEALNNLRIAQALLTRVIKALSEKKPIKKGWETLQDAQRAIGDAKVNLVGLSVPLMVVR